MQLRGIRQTQMDIRQSKVMRFPTAVATVFIPLSLTAGWYDMSFVSMPKLGFPYGCAVVCVLYLLIMIVKIWFSKRKR